MPLTPEPERIEYCLNDKVLTDPGALPFPSEHGTSYGACLALLQRTLHAYWRKEGGMLHRMHKGEPYPDSVRAVAKDGTVICQWSKDDELALTPISAL